MQVIDIPKVLSSRMHEEKMKITRDSLYQSHQAHFIDIEYCLEQDVESFSTFSESEDLFSEKLSMKPLRILEGTTYLGLIFEFANHLQKLPCEIQLWKISRKSDSKLRVYDCVSPNSYSQHIYQREHSYFVRYVTENNSDVIDATYALLAFQTKWVTIMRTRYNAALPHDTSP